MHFDAIWTAAKEGTFNQIWVGDTVWSQVCGRRSHGISNRLWGGRVRWQARPWWRVRVPRQTLVWLELNVEFGSRSIMKGRKRCWWHLKLQVGFCHEVQKDWIFKIQINAFLTQTQIAREWMLRLRERVVFLSVGVIEDCVHIEWYYHCGFMIFRGVYIAKDYTHSHTHTHIFCIYKNKCIYRQRDIYYMHLNIFI